MLVLWLFQNRRTEFFQKVYTCFESQKIGWKSACRRVIHLDGTFLKGRMKGILLTAVGRDPNDAAYVIAWAIVPVENKVYWQWFMELLRENLGLEEGNALALYSDQQKGLAYAIKTVMCARHILSNLRKRYKQMGPLHKVFWKCTRAYNENAFQQTGHNKQKCKLDLVPKPPKLSCGRPFKNSKATTQSPLTDEP